MNVAASPAPTAPDSLGAAPPASTGELCPLCGRALDPAQDWCLSCGAAAQTRLAASPRWKLPSIVLALVTVLALECWRRS